MPPFDRAEDGASDANSIEGVMERLLVGPDARWLKKGGKSYFGYEGFWRADGEGYVERVMARPANEGEAPHLKAMLTGCTAVRLLADKAYSSAANREMLAMARLKSGIVFRASRAHPLTFWQKTFNRLVAKQRWIVEQGFGTLKRLFRAHSRYMTCEKVEAELTFKGAAMNLLKAANRIELVGA